MQREPDLFRAGYIGEAEQPIGRGDDDLDPRTRLCFEQRNRVDQNGLVRNKLAGFAKFGQRRPGLDAGLWDCLGLDILARGQGRRSL